MNDRKTERILSLDGLKGLCALGIAFFWHYRHFIIESFPMYSVFKPLYDQGDALTDVFFIVSGLVIILRYEERIINKEIDFITFFSSRIKRIFPAVILSSIIVALLQFLHLLLARDIFVYPIYSYNLYDLFLNFLGIQYGLLGETFSFNGPAWYISVLLFCYLIYYLIINILRDKKDLIIPVYFLLIQVGLAIYKSDQSGLDYIFVIGRGIAGYFVGGLLAKVLLKREKLNEKVCGYFALIIIVICALITSYLGWGILGNVKKFTIIAFGPLVILSIIFIPWLNSIFSSKFMVWLGNVSFEIFIWHFPVQLFIKIIEIIYEKKFDYSRVEMLLIYVCAVMVTVVFYKKFIANKLNNIYKLFIK